MIQISKIRANGLLNHSVAILLIASIFSSALIYNRAEGGIVLFSLIGAFLSFSFSTIRKDMDSQKILLLHLVFAGSVLMTGIDAFGRSSVNMPFAIEFFGSLVCFSILGFLAYHFLKETEGQRFILPIFGVLCIILLIYTLSYKGRVYDLTGRYVITLGLPLCIFSLCFIGLLNPNNKVHFWAVIFFNTVTLFVASLGIASRAQTLALVISWLVGAFLLKYPLRVKLAYFLIPALICTTYFYMNSKYYANFFTKRFSALNEVVVKAVPITDTLLQDKKDVVKAAPITDTLLHDKKDVETTVKKSEKKRTKQTTDSSINTRLSLLTIGIQTAGSNFLFGAGNSAEGAMIKENVGNYANFHNQFISLIVQGGIFHLIAGICFIFAPLIVLFRSTHPSLRPVLVLPSIFWATLLPFTSYFNLTGMAHLHILFSWLLVALVSDSKPKHN